MPTVLTSSPLASVEYFLTRIGRPIVGRRLVHVDAGRPIDRRIELLRDEQFAGGPVERVAEAVAVEVGEQLAILAVDLLVGEDHLVDAVIVPLVVGRHLIDPLGHAGVEVARPNGHRPLVVAGTLLRVPGRGIARAVIDEVQSRDHRNTSPRCRRRRSSIDRPPRSSGWNPCRSACRDRVVFSGSTIRSESGPSE